MIGCITKKIGMTQVFDESGVATPVTVLELRDNKVVGVRSLERDGYESVQVGVGENPKNKTKSLAKIYGEKKIPKIIKEFRIKADEDRLSVGDQIGVEQFENLEYVDVQANSTGKGFQGVVKRHGMAGGPDTHGSHFHRVPGSIGNCSYPAHVFKGKKMPGQMGFERVTVQNLKLVKVDKENNLMMVRGAVPGKKGNLVIVQKAVKKA